MIGWDPKTEVAPSPRQRKKREEKSVIGRGSWQTDPFTLGEEDKNISWPQGTQVPQASVKNSIKSISP